MGVTIQCSLPADVNIEDGAEVIAILAGLPLETITTGPTAFDNQTFSCEKVKGVRIEPGTPKDSNIFLPLAVITLSGEMIDGSDIHHVYWHFEGLNGTKSINPESTPFWIAICKGLVDFFGGEMIYRDYTTSLCDYKQPSRHSNQTEARNIDVSNDLYEQMAERKRNLKPITIDDIRDAEQHANYDSQVYREADYVRNWRVETDPRYSNN